VLEHGKSKLDGQEAVDFFEKTRREKKLSGLKSRPIYRAGLMMTGIEG
jgi:hypothetical protein